MKWTTAGPPGGSAGIGSGSAPIHSRLVGRSGAAMLSRPGRTGAGRYPGEPRAGAPPPLLPAHAAEASPDELPPPPSRSTRARRQAGPADPRLALRLGGL